MDFEIRHPYQIVDDILNDGVFIAGILRQQLGDLLQLVHSVMKPHQQRVVAQLPKVSHYAHAVVRIISVFVQILVGRYELLILFLLSGRHRNVYHVVGFFWQVLQHVALQPAQHERLHDPLGLFDLVPFECRYGVVLTLFVAFLKKGIDVTVEVAVLRRFTEFFWNKLFRSSVFSANILGITKINNDINSSKLFCKGVPVSKILCFA